MKKTLFVLFLNEILDFGFSEMYDLEMGKTEDDKRPEDLKELAKMLIVLAQGLYLNNDDDVCI